MTPLNRALIEQAVSTLAQLPKQLLHDLEHYGLRQREFTAVLPLRAAKDAAAQNRALNKELALFKDGKNASFTQIPGLHSARWVLLGSPEAGPRTKASSELLVFAMICDGWPRDVLEEIAERPEPGLDAILRYCADYPSEPTPQDRIDYLTKHRIRSRYFYADTRQRDKTAPHLHMSAREVKRVLTLRQRFVDFVVDTQTKSPSAQQEAFERFRVPKPEAGAPLESLAAPGYPFELSPFERPLDHEGLWVRRTAEIIRTRARRDIRARRSKGEQPYGLRQVHAKHHGLLQAQLRVRNDLPLRYCAGIFKPGAVYEAWVRPSSTSPGPQPDYIPDGRGLSIKLLNVPGEPAVPLSIDDGLPNGLSTPTQDFALVSRPTFFMKDARDYAILRSLFDANPESTGERLGVLAGTLLFGAKRPFELSLFARTLLQLCMNPLAVEYHSMIPVLLGGEPVKLSLRPSEAARRVLSGEPLADFVRGSLKDPDNYLRLALQRSLDLLGSSQLELEFAAHVPHEELPPIEDPRIDWATCGAQRVVLATLTVGKQDATSTERIAQGERMVFTPWHARAEHRPLGSLSRSRLLAYVASSEERNRAAQETLGKRAEPAVLSALRSLDLQ